MKQSKSAVFLSILLFTAGIISCKSYSPAFNISSLYSDFNKDLTFVENSSYIGIFPQKTNSSDFQKALIFYPGGLVEFHAYLPLLAKCAQKGIICFLVKMPFDFAFLDISAAKQFPKHYPEIDQWYMAGHSLGGAMAASYISRHKKEFEGLLLLAAYSTKDLSKSDLKILSIYGSKDGILNIESYNKNKKHLPPSGEGLTEIIISGGNHSQFASYGAQKGDYIPEITSEEQQDITVNEFASWAGLK